MYEYKSIVLYRGNDKDTYIYYKDLLKKQQLLYGRAWKMNQEDEQYITHQVKVVDIKINRLGSRTIYTVYGNVTFIPNRIFGTSARRKFKYSKHMVLSKSVDNPDVYFLDLA